MLHSKKSRFWRSVPQFLSGSIVFALLTFVCFRLRLNLVTTACLYSIVIVLLSLQGSFLLSAVFSLIGVGCLAYYFGPLIFSFRVSDPLNVVAIVAFLTTSAVITRLVSRVRKAAGDAKDEEDRIRLIIDTVPALLWTARPDGWIDFISQRRLDYTGMTLERALGTGWETAFHADDLEQILTRWRAALAEGKPFEIEARLRRFDREYRWFLSRAFPLFDLSRHILGWYGNDIDIRDRKLAEEKLQQSQAYLSEAQRLSHTGSFGWNVLTGEIYWSEETYQIFEYDRQAKPTLELFLRRIHPDDRAVAQQMLDRASREKTNFDVELRWLVPDGRVKYLHIVAHGLQESSDNLAFVGAVMDVTATKQAEAALRQSEEHWRDVFENNPTMYFMVDAAGKVMAVNPFGAEQLGYTVDELVGQPVLRVFYESDCEPVQRNVALCMKQLGRSMSWELRKVRKDGSLVWVRDTARAVLRGNDRVILVACEDITECKRAEEALRQAQADLAHVSRVTTMGELTASLAHEVNQPIAAAITNANTCLRWLAGEAPKLEEARAAAARIVKDGTRAAEIISRIHLLFKKGTPEREWVDVNEIIREMIVLLRSEATRYSIYWSGRSWPRIFLRLWEIACSCSRS